MKLEAIEGLSVSIRANGQDIQEYEDESDELYIPSIGRKFIEATSGANFSVHFHSTRHVFQAPTYEDCVLCSVKLDGQWATGRVITLPGHGEYTLDIDGVHGARAGTFYLKPFEFANLTTTDGSIKSVDMKAMASLGEVRVECSWVRKAAQATQMSNEARFQHAAGDDVPEKCLKGRAISNRASLGKEKSVGPQTVVQTTYPYGDKPFSTFIFKYRSRRDLQIEGIIPRDPTPPPLEERDPATLTPEEARELVRRLQAERIKVKKEGVKAEKRTISQVIASDDEDDEDDDDLEVVESEASRRKRTRLSNDSGVEVVDLTDD